MATTTENTPAPAKTSTWSIVRNEPTKNDLWFGMLIGFVFGIIALMIYQTVTKTVWFVKK